MLKLHFISSLTSMLNPSIPSERAFHAYAPPQKRERDETFDILKGIAILLVILGHCEIGPLQPFIFSFHMPLFFFVTGYFLKIRTLRSEIQLSLKRLIIPYIFSAFCICVAAAIVDLSNYAWADGSYTQETIVKHLLGYNGESNLWFVGRIRVLWFLLALFWARIIVISLLSRIKSIMLLCLIFFLLGLLGIILGRFSAVPYCLPQGLSAASFLYMGYVVKKYDLLYSNNVKHIMPFFIILWLYCWNQGGIDINNNFYSVGYVFCLFGATGAFFTLHSIVSHFHIKNLCWKALQFCGRYSLIIFCIHAIESNICNWKSFALLHHIPLEYILTFHFSIRLVIALAFTFLILKIKPLHEGVFQIKT